MACPIPKAAIKTGTEAACLKLIFQKFACSVKMQGRGSPSLSPASSVKACWRGVGEFGEFCPTEVSVQLSKFSAFRQNGHRIAKQTSM